MAAMAKHFFLFLILIALTSVSVLGAEKVMNITGSCAATDNAGATKPSDNLYGTSFLFNTTLSSTAYLSEVDIAFTNSTAVAGTHFYLNVYWNESATIGTDNTSRVCALEFYPSQAAGTTCATSSMLNISLGTSCLLNQTGNYTVLVEQTLAAASQVYIPRLSNRPYMLGKCFNCFAGSGFTTTYSIGNITLWATAGAPPSTYFQLTAQDTKTLGALTIFNATVNGTIFSTTNGTIITTFLANSGNVSIEINATNYNSNSTSSWNTTTNYLGNLTPVFAINNVRDEYDNSVITTFNVTVQNDTGSYNYTTTTGSVYTALIHSQTVNVTLQHYQYFDHGYSVSTSSNFTTGKMTKVEAYLSAKNIVSNATITNFSTKTNLKTFGTNTGVNWINITDGSQPMNFSASGYVMYSKTFVFNTTPLNYTDTVYLTPNITFNLYNESDGSPFHPNQTTSTILRVFCPSATLEYVLTANTSNNSINCAWTTMRMFVTYSNTTYYRTLIPDYTSTSINWYLINLNEKTAVQKQFNLNDLPNQYSEGTFIVEKVLNGAQVRINEDYWDIEQKAIAYFILYDQYILELTDNFNVTRVLGLFLADTTSIHTITVPIIAFSPDQEIDDFEFGYLSQRPTIAGNGWIYMQYESHTGTLNNVTWIVYNASNTAQVFLNTSFTTTNGSANFTTMINGTIYKSILTFNHTSYSTHSDTRTWGSFALLTEVFDGFSNPTAFKQWFSLIVVIVSVLLFSGVTAGAGAVTGVTLAALFYWVGWLVISTKLMIFFGLLALYMIMRGEGIK